MRGPIDYILVAFDGNSFKGDIFKELEKTVKSGTVAVLDLAIIVKDINGKVSAVELDNLDSDLARRLISKNSASRGIIAEDDIKEVGDILSDNCSAGLLIIEQLWAKDLKQAILNANGELMAEGRIHPDANQELDNKEGE